MFYKTSYRRGVVEGVILYTLGRLGALISPAAFPDWVFIIAPLLFLSFQYFIGPLWAAFRIESSKRERLSKRFWLLGLRIALICLGIDIVISLTLGLALSPLDGGSQGSVLTRLFASGPAHLSLGDYAIYEGRTAALLLSFYTIAVISAKLARGGFLRFTMPAGGNRVTL